MASTFSQQYAFRAQKSLGLVGGTPDYTPIPGFTNPEVPARFYSYSADGRLYAYALPSVVRIFQAEGAQLLHELPLPNIIELTFSPRGTYLSTWERPVKLEDGAQHKNLRVFSVSTGEELVAFTQKSQEGWDLQYTISESHAIRLVGGEIQVFRPAEWNKGIIDKLKVEGATYMSLSPGLNPSVAVFVAEKKGAPASIKIFGLLSLAGTPTCQKTFYKADRAQIKWNTLGTQVLLLTQTDVDNTNKSYYGETMLYLLSAAGNFDCRVTLDKEGPIHDFVWSPNSKEFGVVYGYMPAKTVLFDQRVRTIHDFGSAPHNFISFNPQARLLALAGFGNLAGKIDIFDRRTLAKVTTIDAPNTSYCTWSPDGRFLITATLSPRLRVDNGIKIWHCTGPLVHVHLIDELYQASWRPINVDSFQPFPTSGPIAVAPAPSPAVVAAEAAAALKRGTQASGGQTKPAGAYRPPGARGGATPAIYKREDEGGLSRTPSGQNTPARGYNRSPAPPGSAAYANAQQGGQGKGGRYVPGAASASPSRPGATPRADSGEGKANGTNGQAQQGQAGRKRNKGAKKGDNKGGDRPSSIDLSNVNGNGKANGKASPRSGAPTPVIVLPTPATPDIASPVTPGVDGSLDPIAKKVRNLNKKLKAIEELKEKAKRGERLEVTQLKKMEGEAEIRKELTSLGAPA
ncbi:translation initiation factor eIF-2A [Dendrothele bispora CBS 962.96]|uniref:Eukaryotic translation initiation factor 2A n=1 Tax=Dendrothele bispora (strain CBS 962.96) TaxID=1314807 RepID=A0A4S8LUG8_DENBC|nr:translation initiation factor eIF-2A [Dendrothele bispora CBS 962.96]